MSLGPSQGTPLGSWVSPIAQQRRLNQAGADTAPGADHQCAPG